MEATQSMLRERNVFATTVSRRQRG